MTEHDVQMLKDVFAHKLDKIFAEHSKPRIEVNDQGLIAAVRVNTCETVDHKQYQEIAILAHDYNLSYQTSRSGYGVKYEFKLRDN